VYQSEITRVIRDEKAGEKSACDADGGECTTDENGCLWPSTKIPRSTEGERAELYQRHVDRISALRKAGESSCVVKRGGR
jgi:hypothetical protein